MKQKRGYVKLKKTKKLNKQNLKNLKIKDSLLFKNLFVNLCIVMIALITIIALLYKLSAKLITTEIETQIQLQLDAVDADITTIREGQSDELIVLSDTNYVRSMLNGVVDDTFDLLADSMVANYSPYMENVLLINVDGVVLYDSKESTLVGYDLSEREYFQESLGGITCHSDVLISKSTGNLVEVTSVPVISSEGVVAVLATVMNIDYIKDILKEIKINESGYAYLLDSKGEYIYEKDAALVGSNIADLGVSELADNLLDPDNGGSGRVDYTIYGVDKITLYQTIGNWMLCINAVKSEYLASVNTMLLEAIVIGAIMMLIAGLITTLNSYLMVNRIKKVQKFMSIVTGGDLTVEIKEDNTRKLFKRKAIKKPNLPVNKMNLSEGDELSQMTKGLAIMVTTIRNLIKEIAGISEQLSSSSQELSSASAETMASSETVSDRMAEMSAGAQNQTEYVENINTMTHKMNEMLINATSKIDQMESEAEIVSDKARIGDEKIISTISGMEKIQIQTQKIEGVMEELIHQSSEIEQINGIITEIAEKTNLLSLNAAIEAARAGESGRGFAVVAGEIGKLANQSQKSAQGISELILGITESIKIVHNMMDEETEYVKSGIDTVEESKVAFIQIDEKIMALLDGMKEVVSFVANVKESGTSVTEAVDRMSGILEESSAEIEEIAASTEEQTSVAEEIANAATELSEMAEKLLESVSTFCL